MEEQQIFVTEQKARANHTIYVFIVSFAFYNFSQFFFSLYIYSPSVFPRKSLFIYSLHTFYAIVVQKYEMLQQFGLFARKRGAVICKRNIQLIILELEWKGRGGNGISNSWITSMCHCC